MASMASSDCSTSDTGDTASCEGSTATCGGGNQIEQILLAGDATAMSQQALEALARTFQELKSKNQEVRLKASYDLYSLLVLTARGNHDQLVRAQRNTDLELDLPADRFQDFYSNLNHRIAQLVVASNDSNEKIGGILAVEALIRFDGDDAAQKTARLLGFLRAALRSNDNAVLIYAARALGHLAVPGGALTAELVESEVKTALEWLQTERQESRRFAAVLCVNELAKNSPTLFYAFVPQVLDCIWVALRDPKVLIRETAAEAVGSCFEIISARDSSLRQQWFTRMYDETIQGFKNPNSDYVHGSLLTMKELLLKGGMFMHEHYKTACEISLRLKDNREPRIRAQIVTLIPILAGYAPSEFAATYLHNFMIYLQGQLKKDKERNAAFIAIGKVANAVGSAIASYLDGIIVFVREGLSVKA